MDIFRFEDEEKRVEIVEEMSDVFYFLLRMAQKYDIDLTTEFSKKMEKIIKNTLLKSLKDKTKNTRNYNMKVLIQPSSQKEAMKHFADTIEYGVSLNFLKEKMTDEYFKKLKKNLQNS